MEKIDTDQPIIQIAGIRDIAEAHLLLDAGVDWLGFPLRLPVHHEDLSEQEAAEIIAKVREEAGCVLITYLQQAKEIAEFCRELGVNIVQLHGQVEYAEVVQLKMLLPELFIIKSLVVRQDNLPELLRLTEVFQRWVDAFITDTHDPATGADGATGKTHDWAVSRRLVEYSEKPVILAGGLTPENVASAIRTVRPAGVDAHTGVELPNGRKSREKVSRIVQEARRAFREING